MIGVVDVEINAANPHVPLRPVRTFVGSPQSFRVRNVPRRIGEWEIKAVRLWVFYPDSTTETANCVLTGGVWVGTVGASAVPGTSVAGFVVNADGIDEFGQPVVGYILGIGDVEVLTRERSVTPGVITFKGDKGDKGDPGEKGEKGDPGTGAVLSVNGRVGDVVLDAHDVGAYTQEETDDKITRFVAHYLTDKVGGRFVPFATHARLADAKAHHSEANPRFFYAGQGFTPTKNDYCVVLADETVEGKTTRYSFVGEWPTGSWQYQYTINDTAFSEAQWASINSGVTEGWMASTLSAATTALNNAEAAQSTADQALSDAADAMGAASTAQTEARDAKDIADNAQSLAGDAASRAEDAWTAADEARVSAGGAQNTADEAYSLARSVDEKADLALTGLPYKLDKNAVREAFASLDANTSTIADIINALKGI